MGFLTDSWWQNHNIWPTFAQVIFSMLDFWGLTLNCALLHWSHHVLTVLLLDTMPKRKLFNIANLGAWAKSTVTRSTKENVSNCTGILMKLLTFHRLTPLDQHHPAWRRRNARSAAHPCFASGPWAGHHSVAKVCNSIMSACRCLPTWSYQKASCMG